VRVQDQEVELRDCHRHWQQLPRSVARHDIWNHTGLSQDVVRTSEEDRQGDRAGEREMSTCSG
jgi:hypothetical protein